MITSTGTVMVPVHTTGETSLSDYRLKRGIERLAAEVDWFGLLMRGFRLSDYIYLITEDGVPSTSSLA
jgi:hypothetical protein